MKIGWLVLASCVFAAVAGGCGGGAAPAGICASDVDCDDGSFCNGAEVCRPESASADAKGCLKIPPLPCFASTVCSDDVRGCVPLCFGSLLDAPGCVHICNVDADCGHRTFCGGLARCQPGSSRADGRGCVRDRPPCAAGQVCNELLHTCSDQCPDADGDGQTAQSCGGTDCDDSDPQRYAGNTEICDAMKRDEDCDPTTFGYRDSDGDGYVDAACCNGDRCGNDCDDTQPSVHPNQPEVCNHRDDSCSGVIDDGVAVVVYLDADHDGYGAGPGAPGCPGDVGYSLLGNDCDDANPAITPGAMVCQPAESVSAYAICDSAGVYKPSKCQGQAVCHPQPNGLGFCL